MHLFHTDVAVQIYHVFSRCRTLEDIAVCCAGWLWRAQLRCQTYIGEVWAGAHKRRLSSPEASTAPPSTINPVSCLARCHQLCSHLWSVMNDMLDMWMFFYLWILSTLIGLWTIWKHFLSGSFHPSEAPPSREQASTVLRSCGLHFQGSLTLKSNFWDLKAINSIIIFMDGGLGNESDNYIHKRFIILVLYLHMSTYQ